MDPGMFGEGDGLQHLPRARYRVLADREQHRAQTQQRSQTASATFHAYPDPEPDLAYAQANLTAFATNVTTRSTSEKFAQPPDPDDFYRDYRGQQLPNGISSSSIPIPIATANSPMASAVNNRPPPSPRSVLNGNALKNPVLAAGRTALRPAQRSTSNTVDDRVAEMGASRTAAIRGSGPAQKLPSVKDLKKRFDQANAQPPASRPPMPRNEQTVATKVRSASEGFGSSSYSTLRSGTAKDAETGAPRTDASRQTQRQKLAADHQLPSNAQSFASRISRPRPTVATEPRAGKSPTLRSPPVANRQATGLLFGEVLPEQTDFQRPGYGIQEARPRSSASHSRSRSNAELPCSPTDWYRGGQSDKQKDSAPSRAKAPHARAQSDPSSAPPLSNSPVTKRSPNGTLTNENRKREQPLRVSLKKLGTSSSNSLSSTRSNSPVKQTPASGRTSRQNGRFPMSRSRTPNFLSADPVKGPSKTQITSPRPAKKAPPANVTTPSNTKRNAYVSPVPQEKLSPTLRSSRPRQSVATATTAAYRRRVVERVPSPTKAPFGVGSMVGSRAESRTQSRADAKPSDTVHRRKLSAGPIDFAQRRETIKLAYTKSIRETQAREAREAAAETRRRELAAIARRKLEAEAATLAREAEAAKPQAGSQQSEPVRGHVKRPSDSLKIVTDLPTRQSMIPIPRLSRRNSPVLGVPGSFPAFPSPGPKSPGLAVSATTVATEFDVDAQTEPEPPTQVSTAATEHSPVDMMAKECKRASYHSPFDAEGMSDPNEEGQAGFVEAKAHGVIEVGLAIDQGDEAEAEAEHAGTFQDEYEPKPYLHPASSGHETTVTILGPESNFTPSQVLASQESSHVEGEEPRPVPVPSAAEAPDKTEGLETDFYAGPTLGDSMVALRESTLTLSDVDTSGDALPSSAEFQKTPDTSHSLTVPPLLSPTNRLSQFSAWTDYSLDSSDGRDSGARSSFVNPHEPEIREQSSIKSAETGLRNGHLLESSLSDTWLAKHRLPELDTGAGFVVPYYGARPQPETTRLLPGHEPPRPPTENYEVHEDVYAARTRPSSYLQDADEDDGRNETTEAVCISTAPSPHAGESTGPSEKERKRLKQRQMVIRELIDTETIFIRDMTVVEEIYKGTAEACPNLDGKTVKLIFRNSDDIIAFHTVLLAQLKDGVSSVYAPRGRKSPGLLHRDSIGKDSDAATINSTASSAEFSDEKDRMTTVGDAFIESIDKLKTVHEAYLRTSDQSIKRLMQMQEDPTVKVWLNECNEVAKDLTSAWNLDSLLIKPMQRITKYPDIITHLLKHTPDDHPDRASLIRARAVIMEATDEINKSKKNFELVGQIVSNRKRKESDVRTGIARAFGKRVDKLQPSKPTPEDDEYSKLHEKFGDDYLRLQVVLRDVEYYTRTVSTYVREFLQYLSSMELVMRLQPSKYHSHLESKWVQFNVSMRDMEKVALDRHLADIRKHVIEPFEEVIRCYTSPATAMRKRTKRRQDHERFCQLKAANKKIDKQLADLNEQYEALNDTLKKELPRLSELTATVGNICLGKFVSIQAAWYRVWQEKIKMPLADDSVPDMADIVKAFQRDFKEVEEECGALGILNSSLLRKRASQSTTDDSASTLSRSRSSRPITRGRGLSVNSDSVPSLPTPDLAKRNSGVTQSPKVSSPHHFYYRDYYAGIHAGAQRGAPISPSTVDSSRFVPVPRAATERSVSEHSSRVDARRHSNPPAPSEPRRFSGLFHSALPLAEGGSGTGPDESQSASRASSRDRRQPRYNVMYLAASLFEFNIQTAKHEAGYPYLTYQAGEIFDVIAEKGELWLAKNQDDPDEAVGWIWSKHFAQLADS